MRQTPTPTEIRTVEIEVERPVPRPPVPRPQPVDLSDIDWIVITPETLPEGDAWVIFGISPEDYERLSGNTAELLRWIREAGWRLDYYEGKITATQIPG